MKNSFRTDIATPPKGNKFNHLYYKNHKQIEVLSLCNNFDYRLITFKNLDNIPLIKNVLKKELSFYLKRVKHTLIIGLGNESLTADSIGPKALKYIKPNAHLKDLGVDLSTPKVSLLEPGVLGTTGISTKKTIKSIAKEIKPDLILLIDSYITDNIHFLNHTIQITNEGIIPGSGIKGTNEEISLKTLKIPIVVIGVPTAIELKESDTFIVSTSNVDEYVLKISQIIGEAINELLYFS